MMESIRHLEGLLMDAINDFPTETHKARITAAWQQAGHCAEDYEKLYVLLEESRRKPSMSNEEIADYLDGLVNEGEDACILAPAANYLRKYIGRSRFVLGVDKLINITPIAEDERR